MPRRGITEPLPTPYMPFSGSGDMIIGFSAMVIGPTGVGAVP